MKRTSSGSPLGEHSRTLGGPTCPPLHPMTCFLQGLICWGLRSEVLTGAQGICGFNCPEQLGKRGGEASSKPFRGNGNYLCTEVIALVAKCLCTCVSVNERAVCAF